MVKIDLTDAMVSAGAEILKQLDRVNFRVVGALWLYMPEANRWRLVLASPMVRTKGPQAAYRKVEAAMRRLPDLVAIFSLGDITVVKDTDPLIALLRKAV